MAGPTTEVLNEDIKELKGDIRKLAIGLAELRAEVHALAVGLAGLAGEFGAFKWLLGLTLAITLSGVGGGIWWAGNINAKVYGMEGRTNEKFQEVGARIDKLESSLDARFDKLEASIARALEQARPAAPRPGP